MKIRIVLDTNILVSALIFGGKPRIIFELATLDQVLEAVTSQVALEELLRILRDKFRYNIEHLTRVENEINSSFIIIEQKKPSKVIITDSFDNNFLAIADSAKAHFIISGDRHLLGLKKYKNIGIITPTKFLEEVLE